MLLQSIKIINQMNFTEQTNSYFNSNSAQ